MPEFKAQQKTFTIHFDEQRDLIDKSHQYIQTWKFILQQYQTIFNGAEILKTEILEELAMGGIPQNLVGSFQIYIDTINSMLDTEFKVLKPILFPNVWKFGVAVFSFDTDSVTFREYAIEKGSNGPLLVSVPSGFTVNDGVSSVRSETHITRFSIDVQKGGSRTKTLSRTEMLFPELKAKEFLYQVYRTGFEERFFKLGGTLLYKETIFAFVDRFSFMLGISNLQVLSLNELFSSMILFLPAWYELALEKHGMQFHPESPSEIPSLDGPEPVNNFETLFLLNLAKQ